MWGAILTLLSVGLLFWIAILLESRLKARRRGRLLDRATWLSQERVRRRAPWSSPSVLVRRRQVLADPFPWPRQASAQRGGLALYYEAGHEVWRSSDLGLERLGSTVSRRVLVRTLRPR